MDEKHQAEVDGLLSKPGVRDAEFKTLFETQFAGVAFVTRDGEFIRVNRKFAEMLGYTVFELNGRVRWQDITHPQDVKLEAEQLEALAKGETEGFKFPKRFLSKSGNTVFCEVLVSRVDSDDDEFVHFIKQSTELKLSDKNLQVVKDADGNHSLQPVLSVMEFVKANWKAIGSVAVAVVGGMAAWIGSYVSTYWEMRSKYELQEQRLKQLDHKVNSIKSQQVP